MIKFSQRQIETSTIKRNPSNVAMCGGFSASGTSPLGVGRNPLNPPKVLQGALATIPVITDSNLLKILDRMISLKYGIAIEWTTDPHPRNVYWDLWCSPLFPYKPHQDTFKRDEAITGESVRNELRDCVMCLGGQSGSLNKTADAYVKLSFFDPTRGVESTVLSFIIARPAEEMSYHLSRTEGPGRKIVYSYVPVRF